MRQLPLFLKKKMVHISEREEQLPDQVIEKLIELMVEHPDVLSLGPGEPDFALPKPLIAEVKRLSNQVNHYSPAGGIRELREAICKKVRRDNHIKTSPDNIVVTCGAQEALLLSAACTLDVSEQILLPNPGFMGFLPCFELFDAGIGYYRLNEGNSFVPDPDEIRKQVDPKKTKVILLNSPANPTGSVISKKILEEIADIAVEFDLSIFSDEAYEKIVYDDAKHVSIASLNGLQDRVFTCQSFSKSFAMCGFRLGYVVAPEGFAGAIKKTHIYTSICAPTISQKLGIKALSLSSNYTRAMVREYDERRKVIVKRLNTMGLSTPNPKGAFYTFSNISHINKSSKQFAFDLLKKQRVAVIPGIDFGSEGEGFIRCSFARKLPVIEKALDRIEKFVF
ncbi:MAG: aminotransferase class I/II-fold pyridoxal phosphate-dependent enzyme [Candidatus Woesearchaeota archaeon]|nr:aminotransferase class I/II-fold pyridoxal phosphate-dependent enzyme [Candidatus Woesearchaeota archaeon]